MDLQLQKIMITHFFPSKIEKHMIYLFIIFFTRLVLFLGSYKNNTMEKTKHYILHRTTVVIYPEKIYKCQIIRTKSGHHW